MSAAGVPRRPTRFEPFLARLLAGGGRGLHRALDVLGDTARVVDFLRGWIEFEVRPDDIFVVSYPRSGTTWLQMILYQLLTDGRMDLDHISDFSPWFERSLAVGTHQARDFARLAPPRVFKSHLPYAWLPRGARAIYVVRNGMDVAVSYYHFYRSHLGFSGSFDDFFDRFLRGRLQYRSWFRHVAVWRAHADDAGVLLLSYGDLHRDLAGAVRRIIGFLGIEIDPGRLPGILERCSFDFMKRHEEKFDHVTVVMRERGLRPGGFIRAGRTGSGRLELTPAQKEAFSARFRREAHPTGPELHLADFLH